MYVLKQLSSTVYMLEKKLRLMNPCFGALQKIKAYDV